MKTSTKAIALTLAGVVLHAVPAAGAPSACETRVQANASRVKAAVGPFTAALGADAQKRLPDGYRALIYGELFFNCEAGRSMQGVGSAGGTGEAMCYQKSRSVAALDPGASPLDGGFVAISTQAADRSAGYLRSFLTRPVPEPTRQSAGALLAAVEEGANILRGCAAELSKPVLERKVMPAPPARPPARKS